MPHNMPSPEMLACIKVCGECASVCAQTAHHCLHLGGEHASPDHQCLLHDCRQICGTAVGFMARSSHYSASICKECAEICTACADDCDRLANGDQPMKQCAEVCRKCATACEKMASATV
jgi:hypothetical protein